MGLRRLPKLVCVLSVAVVLGVASIAMSACDSPRGPSVSFGPTSLASAPAGISTVITTGAFFPSPVSLCATTGALTTGFDLIVTSRANISVDHVTLHLLDGSNIGASPITFPRAGLTAQFGNTLVRAGSSRTFSLTPTFTCRHFLPRFIRGDIVTIDDDGVRQSSTTQAAFP